MRSWIQSWTKNIAEKKKKTLLRQLMKIRTDNNIAYIVNFLILIIVLWLSKRRFLFLKNIQKKFSIAKGHSLQIIFKSLD